MVDETENEVMEGLWVKNGDRNVLPRRGGVRGRAWSENLF
jgi:hypothetical protein